jgi:hypothetical protein
MVYTESLYLLRCSSSALATGCHPLTSIDTDIAKQQVAQHPAALAQIVALNPATAALCVANWFTYKRHDTHRAWMTMMMKEHTDVPTSC